MSIKVGSRAASAACFKAESPRIDEQRTYCRSPYQDLFSDQFEPHQQVREATQELQRSRVERFFGDYRDAATDASIAGQVLRGLGDRMDFSCGGGALRAEWSNLQRQLMRDPFNPAVEARLE